MSGSDQGDAPRAAPGASPGATLGPYRLVRELGTGGMGRVFRAEVVRRTAGLEPGAVVAVKLIHPHLLAEEGSFKRFMREAEIGRSVNHPNIVRTLDVDAMRADLGSGAADVHYCVLEFVEGQTLRALLHDLGRVPEALCRHVGREAAKGLAALHQAGAVHRDVKPENILITPENEVKLMDLGVARRLDGGTRLSSTGAFVGSVLYAAPEQFTGGGADVDARTDLYSLGATLYEIATSVHPFESDDFAHAMQRILREEPRRCGEVNPQLTPFFEELVHSLLAKDPAGRVATADLLAGILAAGEQSPWWTGRSTEIRAVTRRPLRRIRIERETPIHGRAAELARLGELFSRARNGDGSAVLVEGEPGIGKSRLVDEFAAALERAGEDVHFLAGVHPPGGAATSSGAFCTAYREQFGAEGLDATLRSHLGATPALVPAFAALLRGEGTPPGAEPLTRDSLQTLFIHATRSLAAQRPTVILIDDLHFAPEEGRALFAALATAVDGHRALLIGTTRPGLDERWVANLERVGVPRIPLRRLGAKDLVAMLADSLGSERLAEELAGKVGFKSDGNPWFVFEILRELREQGLLRQRSDGTWATTKVIDDVFLPSSVREMVETRVADLDEEERNLLDVAACAGFEFDPMLVGRVLGLAQIPLMRTLAKIERKTRLVRSLGRRFVFDQQPVQSALHDALPELLREPYHSGLADALLASAPEGSTPESLGGAACVELCGHLLAAGRGADAARFLPVALGHLDAAHLSEDAVRLCDRMLAAPGALAGAARLGVVLGNAARLDLLGRRAEQRAALDEACELADAQGASIQRAESRSLVGRLLWNTGRSAEAVPVLEEAIGIARAAGESTEVLRVEADARLNLGHALAAVARRTEARAAFEGCLDIARRLSDPVREAKAIGSMALLLRQEGRLLESLDLIQRDVELHRAAGARRGEAMARGNLGIVLANLGRTAEARASQEECLSVARQLGDRRTELIALHALASLDYGDLQFAAAERRFAAVGELAQDIQHRAGESAAAQGTAIVRRAQGRIADALREAERSAAHLRDPVNPAASMDADILVAEIRCAMGDPVGARALATASLGEGRRVGNRRSECFALAVLADCAECEGDLDEAADVLGRVVAIRREIRLEQGLASVLARLGQVLEAMGRSEEAGRTFAEAARVAAENHETAPGVVAAAQDAAIRRDREAAARVWRDDCAKLGVEDRIRVGWAVWRATGDRAALDDTAALVERVAESAPEPWRAATLSNVPLHRDVLAAARG